MIIDIPKILARYAELKVIEKAHEKEMEELKPFIREYMMTEAIDKLPTTAGMFTLGERTTWQYSKEVEKLQKAEKADGTAKEVKSVVLTFKATEENE